tara:strand:- start:7989 stop:8834 length:846 start_codon:yes stop_codon:yes gene_type:complete
MNYSEILQPLIKKFLPFAQKTMGFSDPPRLFLKSSSGNASNPLGKTAYYDPNNKSITVYVTNRHPKDIMRSLSHELVHHTQNCKGEFDNVGAMGDGYAQNDEHLREMEREAYEVGNLCFRDWEDSVKNTIYFEHLQKGDYKMSTKDWKNKEIKSLLSEAWGFKMDLSKLTEGEKMPDGDGDKVPPWADKDDDDPDVQEESVEDSDAENITEEEEEEELDEQSRTNRPDRARPEGGRRLDEEEDEPEVQEEVKQLDFKISEGLRNMVKAAVVKAFEEREKTK